MKGICLTLVLFVVCRASTVESLKCYTCSNIGNVSDCLTVTRCSGDQECYTEAVGVGNNTIYNLGCRSSAQCRGTTTKSPMSIVGRHIDIRTSSTGCNQCCAVDSCNDILCTHASQVISGTDHCHDDPVYNCELFSGTFNLCGDIHHAKLVCRKWCGLCDLVDGVWSVWSAWSICDTTCGQGHTSRTRSCTEPAPSHGGLDCVGTSVQVSNCSVASCPVHGAWSTWTSWGECSVTCSVGLQRRDRSCSQPYPGPGGNHCFGDARDDRVCFLKACADGGWSSWSSWGNCSSDWGQKSRSRICDNPAPSSFGKYCHGSDEEHVLCNTKSYPDGGWSSWSTWGSCSASCDGGQKSRSRMCDNPAPSSFGKYCHGSDEEHLLCNTKSCPAPVVVFSVTDPSSHLADGSTNSGVPIFQKILTNVGNGYNTTSGVFTCVVPGIYQFSFSFMSASLGSHCNIYQNDKDRIYTENTDSSLTYWKSASISIYLNMLSNDTVHLQCADWQHVGHGASTVFNGALIAAI